MTSMRRARSGLSVLLVSFLLPCASHLRPRPLPPPAGPDTPRVEPIMDAEGLYRQSWFHLSFLDLKDDFNEAKAEGKRFAVIFEQQGCIYCKRCTPTCCPQVYQRLRARELPHPAARPVGRPRGDRLRRQAHDRKGAWRTLGRDLHPYRRVLQGRPGRASTASGAASWKPPSVCRSASGRTPSTTCSSGCDTRSTRPTGTSSASTSARVAEREALKAKGPPRATSPE